MGAEEIMRDEFEWVMVTEQKRRKNTNEILKDAAQQLAVRQSSSSAGGH